MAATIAVMEAERMDSIELRLQERMDGIEAGLTRVNAQTELSESEAREIAAQTNRQVLTEMHEHGREAFSQLVQEAERG